MELVKTNGLCLFLVLMRNYLCGLFKHRAVDPLTDLKATVASRFPEGIA
jgi:hypothetical protein